MIKAIQFVLALAFFTLSSCGSMVGIHSDYDTKVDFSAYKTYAYYKTGIDKVEISDLDKRRILAAIDKQMLAKGFAKSDTPDILITFFTKSREQVNVNQLDMGWGWGWGWNPYLLGARQTTVNTTTEGTLYIDFVDAKKKEMIWQGEGTGVLTKNAHKKEQRMNEFVSQILSQYPPQKK